MNKTYPSLLIIFATALSLYNALAVTVGDEVIKVYAQLLLLIFAIVVLTYLLNNNLNKWVTIVFSGIHILIALTQSMIHPAIIFSIVEILLYIGLIVIAPKSQN